MTTDVYTWASDWSVSHVRECLCIDCMARVPVLWVIILLPRSFTELILEQLSERQFYYIILKAGKPRMWSLCSPIAESEIKHKFKYWLNASITLSIAKSPVIWFFCLQEMGLKIPAHEDNTPAY